MLVKVLSSYQTMIGVDWLQSMLGIWRCLLVGPQHLLNSVLCIEWPGFTFLQVQDYCLVHVLLSYMSRSDHCKNHLSVIFQQKKNKNEISWPKELEVVTSRSSGEWYRRILERNASRMLLPIDPWCWIVEYSLVLSPQPPSSPVHFSSYSIV